MRLFYRTRGRENKTYPETLLCKPRISRKRPRCYAEPGRNEEQTRLFTAADRQQYNSLRFSIT